MTKAAINETIIDRFLKNRDLICPQTGIMDLGLRESYGVHLHLQCNKTFLIYLNSLLF